MRVFFVAAFVLALAAVVPLAAGCGGKKKRGGGGDDDGGDDGVAKKEQRTPVESTGWATLKGKVTLEGDRPSAGPIAGMTTHADKKVCLAGDERETCEQTWLVDKNGGVSDVAIWLRVPDGKYFKIHESYLAKGKTKPKELRQPHCAFIPHVLTLFPSYYDGKQLVPSPEEFYIINDAPVPHNSNMVSTQPLENANRSYTLAPGEKTKKIDLNPQPDGWINVSCSVHPWMGAKLFAFDHPYHARTKEDGTFIIENVPAGVPVDIVAWHEGVKGNYALPEFAGTAQGQQVTLEPGKERELSFKLRR
jgi:hypothetical protein